MPIEVRNQLEREAARGGVTLNAIANAALKKHTRFDGIMGPGHSVVLEKHVFSRLVEGIDVHLLKGIGRDFGEKTVKEIFGFSGFEFTVENLIAHYFEPMGAYSGVYEVNRIRKGSLERLVLRHEYGMNWSVFLGEHLSGVFNSILAARPKIEVENNLVGIDLT
jgi:hypothetical protein